MRERWARVVPGLAAWAGLAGCANYAMNKSSPDTGSGAADTALGGDDTGEGDGGAEPAWWGLSAELEVRDGAVAAEGTLTVNVYDADLVELCTTSSPIGAVVEAEETPDPELVYRWFAVDAAGWDGACATVLGRPEPVGDLDLGLGAMFGDVATAALASGAYSEDLLAALNGAYASTDGGQTVWAFGVAGPAAAWNGEGVPAEDAALADGTWWVRPVYLFALSSGSTGTKSSGDGQ